MPPPPPTESELGTALSRMAPPPAMAEAELPRSATTIDALPVEMLTEVLLRVSTPAALVNAAAVSRSWRSAIATPAFLARYRERHTSSTFLGIYVPREFAGPPLFHIPDSIRLGGDDARHVKDAARRASDFCETRRYQDHRLHDADAFILGNLLVDRRCRFLDCHNGRLLLTRGDEALEALEVRSPLARESILLPPPPDVVDPYCFQACLLHGHDKAAAAFRVVCLQHRRERRSRQARAVEYDSRRKSWQDHPWETINSTIEGTPEEVMHAGHWIFCKYTGTTPAALVLDTRNMQFSVRTLPSYQNFAIGEIEDNVTCFVEADGCADHRFKVWQLDEEKFDWDLKEDIEMDQVLGHVGYYRPRAISNGIAIVCSSTTQHHFVVDLKTCSVKEELEFHCESAYPIHMPWPPVFSCPTANGGFDRDGVPASVGDTRIGIAYRVHGGSATNAFDDGGLAKLSVGDADADARTGARESDEINDPSPGPTANAAGGFDQDGEPASVGDATIGVACRVHGGSATNAFDDGGLAKLSVGDADADARTGAMESDEIDDPSPGPTAYAAGGFDRHGGPASMGDTRTGFWLSDWIAYTQKLERNTKVIADAGYQIKAILQDLESNAKAIAAAGPPLLACHTVACRVHRELATNAFDDSGPAKLSVDNADADIRTGSRASDEIDDPSPDTYVAGCVDTNPLLEAKKARLLHSSSVACFVPSSSTAPSALMDLTTAGSPSCPHQGKKRAGSRQSKESPKAMGLVRRNWKRKPKHLKAIDQRRHHLFSIASKISEVQIATSSCREASKASTVSVLGGSGSTLKFTDVGKQPIIDVSITGAPSLSDPSAGESAEQRDEAAQDSNEPQEIEIEDPTATPTSATTEQSFGKDKNYVSNDYLIPDICDPFSDLMNPKAAGGSCWVAGPASVGDSRTGSGELDTIEDLFSGTLAMAPPAAPAVGPEEKLIWRSRSPFCVHSLDNDLPLQPPALASCPQQGRKRANSRESEGSPEAKGPGRRNWKRPKYLEAIFDLRRRQSSSITSKISDEVQIATSSCSEASEASTAAVSSGECKLLFGGSGSTLKFTDVGKQPISDVSVTRAPSLSDPGESAEQRGAVAQDSNEPQDIDIQPTATAPTSATTEQSFGKDKNYVSYDYLTPDICGPFSDLMNPKAAGGFDHVAGPASVGDTRTGSGSDTVEDLFVGTLAMARPVEPLIWRSRSPFSVHSPDNDLLLQPPALASCPQQGRKRADSRESKGSPEAEGPRRRNWKQKPKYLEAIFDLRRHLRSKKNLRRRHSSSVTLKISDEEQIATSSFTEESAASTAAVGSTFTDSGKQPIIDVSITNAPSDFYPSGELAEQRDEAARDKGSPEPTGRGRREKKLNPKYVGGDGLFDDDCHRSPPPRSAPPKDTFPTYSRRRRRFAVTMAAEWEGKNPAGGGGGDNPQHQQAVLQADPAQEAGGQGTGLELEDEKADQDGEGGGTGDKDDVEDAEEVMSLATLCLDFGKNLEPESGRCRRTDGKKWRCSRNTIPNEKYCERHIHFGRKRPVRVDFGKNLEPKSGRCRKRTVWVDFGKNTEPESGRCQRTDGKKWQCSRNTIPNEKYCERHMHLGRKRPGRVDFGKNPEPESRRCRKCPVRVDFGKNPEPESGRCRRTDGNKWRCSRSTIPNEKYCERHIHFGRKRPHVDFEKNPRPKSGRCRRTDGKK